MKTIFIFTLLFSMINGISQPYSATDNVIVNLTNSNVTSWGRGFDFTPNVDIELTQMGKRVLNAFGTFTWKIWETSTQTLIHTQVSGSTSPGQYIYEPITAPVTLYGGTEYTLSLYSDLGGYYYGTSSQVNSNLTYGRMRYCGACPSMPFPPDTLTNFHYGTPDFLFTICTGVIRTVTYNQPVLTANAGGATYQWLLCDFNYAPIPGATNQNYTVTSYGNYAVAITVNGCTDTSACMSAAPVGINESPFFTSVKIYPNPSTGVINIEAKSLIGAVNYSLTTIEGKIVKEGIYNSSSTLTLDLSNENKGVYFLQLLNKEGSKTYKVVRE